MSDRGLTRSYRHMHGFGSHTFSFLNASNERFWVKFHLRIRKRHIANCSKADPAYGAGVVKALGLVL